MKCCFCGKRIDDVQNPAVDDTGEIIAACDKCYKLTEFFRGGRRNAQSRRSNEGHKQKIQSADR